MVLRYDLLSFHKLQPNMDRANLLYTLGARPAGLATAYILMGWGKLVAIEPDCTVEGTYSYLPATAQGKCYSIG